MPLRSDRAAKTKQKTPAQLDRLRLPDYLPRHASVLFVGINPGARSALLGHHFAGYSNRFWKLLFESGLTPLLLRATEDARLQEWHYGITNLVPRPTPGIDTLRPEEFVAGLRALRRKVRRARPRTIAFVGLTLYRFVFNVPARVVVSPGLQAEIFEGARVFVLPNPSGRNAHFSYQAMLAPYRELRLFASKLEYESA